MRASLRALLVIASAAAITGCSSTDAPTATETPEASETAASKTSTARSSPQTSTRAAPAPKGTGVVVQVAVTGDKVTPAGDRIDAKVGEPVTFKITSDRPGGLHVHSDPEQTPEFKMGTSTVKVTVDKPGLVDVEEHEADKVLVQLEVR